jgi:hypothetical protein
VLLEQPDDAEREPARNERLTALGDVLAIDDDVDDAREGRGRPMPFSSSALTSEASV